MAPRPRASSAPGSGRGRAGRRPSRSAGSTRRTTRAPDPAAAGTGTGTQQRRSRLTGRMAILLLIVAVLAVSYASSVKAWLNQRSETNQLKAEIAERKADIASLEQAKRRWHDPAYIETQARLRFGWLMPGEKGYRVIGADGSVLAHGSSELSDPAAKPAPKPEWWESEWRSVVEAGKTPEQVAAEK
ncbi:MAG: FtsB family cell division protein, partial [Nocardioidaceae bacterium]